VHSLSCSIRSDDLLVFLSVQPKLFEHCSVMLFLDQNGLGQARSCPGHMSRAVPWSSHRRRSVCLHNHSQTTQITFTQKEQQDRSVSSYCFGRTEKKTRVDRLERFEHLKNTFCERSYSSKEVSAVFMLFAASSSLMLRPVSTTAALRCAALRCAALR